MTPSVLPSRSSPLPTRPVRVHARTGRALVRVLALAGLLAGCGPRGADENGPRATGAAVAGTSSATAVLLRGRLRPDGLVLEPVFAVASPATPPPLAEGPHRLVGRGDGGSVLFDVRFQGTPVAELPGDPEEHFTLIVPVGEGSAARLAAVELRAGDGRTVGRAATLSASELGDLLGAGDAVSAHRMNPSQVGVRWDAAILPEVMVRDPDTGQVLAFLRGGEGVLVTGLDVLEVAVSEGVRSGVLVVPVRLAPGGASR